MNHYLNQNYFLLSIHHNLDHEYANIISMLHYQRNYSKHYKYHRNLKKLMFHMNIQNSNYF